MACLSPADSAALEYALRARDLWKLPVLAVAAGGEFADPVLREAVALGADALRIPLALGDHGTGGPRGCDSYELFGDPSPLAASLADAIRSAGDPVLVVCGDRSSLAGVGAVPALLAHHHGAAQALGLVSLSVQQDRTILAERRLDGGWRERLRLSPPAVCSVEAAGVRLRRASLELAVTASSARIPVARTADRGGRSSVRLGAPRFYRPRTKLVQAPSGETHDRIVALTGALANREPSRVVGPLDPGPAADELIDFLRRAGVEVPGPS
jgi:electron transfer flavoprotein beta subunit